MSRRNAGRSVLAAAAVILAMTAAADESIETGMRQEIRSADASTPLAQLTTLVRDSAACCRRSRLVSRELTQWLRESHPIYSGRLPTEASQFRGFLLASLGSFVPDDQLYGYVRAGFLFGDHAFDVAAAAVAARQFPDRADELLPLMERYLRDSYEDSWVDLTTPELNYPLAHATRARDEILQTLIAFGSRASHSLPQLDAIVNCPNCGNWAADAALPTKAAQAAEQIRKSALPADGPVVAATAEPPALRVIDRRQRTASALKTLQLIDQEGESADFADLQGRPFALTFLYSQCANPQKCVLTVRRLGELANECAASGLATRVGVYGMTYDPQFDSPSILKRYGSMYGMKFGRHVRLFKTTGSLSEEFRQQLALRVSYGAGSVNQHGIQLFVFDKHGRLAAMQDNELWSPADVRNVLARLAAE